MKLYKYLLMLPLAFMVASCSDENKEDLVEEHTSDLKAVYPRFESMLWNTGETITYTVKGNVQLDQMTNYTQIVGECAQEIMDYANIKLKKVNNAQTAQVVFNFKSQLVGLKSGNTSYYNVVYSNQKVGKREFYNGGEIEITYSDFLSESEVRHLVLHEFCHVLGLQDEIYNSEFDLKLNYYGMVGCYDRNEEHVPSENYFDRVNASSVSKMYYARSFDRNSVMMFYVPASCNLTDGKEIKEATSLSACDKEILLQMYPYRGNMVPIYAGSDKNTVGVKGAEGILGQFNHFADKTKIRKKIGYGYIRKVEDTYPMYKVEKKVNNVVKEIRYCLGKKDAKGNEYYSNGVNSTFDLSNKVLIAYVYDNVGYKKAPIEVYYGNQTRSYSGVSFVDDKYLIDKGNYAPGYWAAVCSEFKEIPGK